MNLPSNVRCGIGYDSHRLVPGRKLIIGCVEIPCDRGLLGHSDGDVLSHAIVDALLGAAGLGDIGSHFSDSDSRWKNSSSSTFLDAVRVLLHESNYRILNLDSVVILDRPKLAPHMTAIRQSLATAIGIPETAVNVKAKTSEGVHPDLAVAQAIVLLAGNTTG